MLLAGNWSSLSLTLAFALAGGSLVLLVLCLVGFVCVALDQQERRRLMNDCSRPH